MRPNVGFNCKRLLGTLFAQTEQFSNQSSTTESANNKHQTNADDCNLEWNFIEST